MIAATRPVQRPADAKLLVIDEDDRFVHARRAEFVDFLQPGDLVVANDAATLPGSLRGMHERTGLPRRGEARGPAVVVRLGCAPLLRRRLRRGRLPHPHRTSAAASDTARRAIG